MHRLASWKFLNWSGSIAFSSRANPRAAPINPATRCCPRKKPSRPVSRRHQGWSPVAIRISVHHLFRRQPGSGKYATIWLRAIFVFADSGCKIHPVATPDSVILFGWEYGKRLFVTTPPGTFSIQGPPGFTDRGNLVLPALAPGGDRIAWGLTLPDDSDRTSVLDGVPAN